MKRLFSLIMIFLLLCGCGGKAEYLEPSESVPLAQPTEPPGSYDPDSTLEMFTNGSVRAYPQNIPDIFAIACAGEDLIVFSGKGNTVLTRLTGENLFRIAEVQLDVMVDPDEPSMQITAEQLVYLDRKTGEMVFLDGEFREFNREKIPEGFLGDPILSSDGEKIYYCSEIGIHVMDTQTNISRLITELSYMQRLLDGLLLDDRVLQCWVFDGQQDKTLFLDTQSGAILGIAEAGMTVSAGKDRFYGRYEEVEDTVFIFGEESSPVQMLTLDTSENETTLLPGAHGVLSLQTLGEGQWLRFFDLTSGRMIAQTQLPETLTPRQYAEDPENYYVYGLSHGAAESTVIFRWDMKNSLTHDPVVYTGPWYTMENPDTEGLEKCESYARELGEKYGLRIHIWEPAVEAEPWDYDLRPEYRVPEIREGLTELDAILSQFPTGFFGLAMEGMEDGMLHISLVRSMNGSHAFGSLEEAEGIQFWLDNDAYVAVALGDTFERNVYHELFHVLESRVLSKSTAYYRWDELNPTGFTYDHDYITNLERVDSQWTTDDQNRAFIDTYSMSYPKEDRARIMEYACMEGNESYFLSTTMQKKLRTLCLGLREAYGLEDSPEVFLWERYLKSPLAHQ